MPQGAYMSQTESMQTSENAVWAKFGELTFHALRCIAIIGRAEAMQEAGSSSCLKYSKNVPFG
jgi:hypothetical protein